MNSDTIKNISLAFFIGLSIFFYSAYDGTLYTEEVLTKELNQYKSQSMEKCVDYDQIATYEGDINCVKLGLSQIQFLENQGSRLKSLEECIREAKKTGYDDYKVDMCLASI